MLWSSRGCYNWTELKRLAKDKYGKCWRHIRNWLKHRPNHVVTWSRSSKNKACISKSKGVALIMRWARAKLDIGNVLGKT